MTVYFSTFTAGFSALILDLMKRDIEKAKNIEIFDGGVVYESDVDPGDIGKIKYFNNSFIVLRKYRYDTNPSTEVLNRIICDLLNSKKGLSIPSTAMKSFKVLSSLENTLAKVDGKLMYHLVEFLKNKTGKSYNSNSADSEFWILYRSEMVGFFMLRITQNKKKLKKGELRPELTNLLCELSEPEEDDVFIDPFCGSGAIALERSRMLNFRGIFASDGDENLISALRNKIKKMKASKIQKSFFVKKLDFFANSFDDDFFDTMVTDPPWGIYENIEEDFYPKFLEEASRILKPNGKLVLLTAKKEYFYGDSRIGNFFLKKHFDILVSGKKTGVYLLIKSR
ncbi:MAG: methyltransferase [Rickettsiales bacterium]|jgi:predicted RNA methylase|nr:methyltransferase [Rickettsiales bacterium]